MCTLQDQNEIKSLGNVFLQSLNAYVRLENKLESLIHTLKGDNIKLINKKLTYQQKLRFIEQLGFTLGQKFQEITEKQILSILNLEKRISDYRLSS